MSDGEGNHKKIWASGYFAGLEKGREENRKMNHARFASKYNNLSISEQKVFDAVPIKEAWTIEKIHNEYARSNAASGIGKDQVKRCLMRLVEAKLIKQSGNALFSKDKPPSAKSSQSSLSVVATDSKEDSSDEKDQVAYSALEKLYNSAEEFRRVASEALAAAQELDGAILQIEEKLSQTSAENEKFEQLKKLLGELSPGKD